MPICCNTNTKMSRKNRPIPKARANNPYLDVIAAKMPSDDANPGVAIRRVVFHFEQLFHHCKDCTTPHSCRRDFCWKFRGLFKYIGECNRLKVACPLRLYMTQLFYFHARLCKETVCRLPYCANIKRSLLRKAANQEISHEEILQELADSTDE